jgi:hypothetical protein
LASGKKEILLFGQKGKNLTTFKNPYRLNLTDFNAKKGCTSRPMKALFQSIQKHITKH